MPATRTSRLLRRLRTPLLAVAGLLLAVVAVDVLADGPLRQRIERTMNERLRGYSVTLDAVDFSPWTFSLELEGLSVAQDAHPEPPVAWLPRTEFSVHWRSLLLGRLVGDVVLDAPRLHVDLAQLEEERDDEVELDDRGWQDAILAAYPLKINELEVHGGAIAYRQVAASRPLELTAVEVQARNIRNIQSPERVYPSDFRASGRVFDEGLATVEGLADFLAEPRPGVKAAVSLARVPLDRLDPLSRDVRLVLRGGQLSAKGEVESTAAATSVHLEDLLLAGVRIDYLFDRELTERAIAAAKAVERETDFHYRLDRLRIADGEVGFVDRTREPGYRLFVSEVDLNWIDLASRSTTPSRLRLEGKFMGSGETVANGVFRPDGDGADFAVGLAIRGTELATMNDLLRTYAKLDVQGGVFSLYSEIEVADGSLDGYVKPLFEDVDVYEPGQDRHKNFFRRIWERLAEGLSELLANRKRDELATIVVLRGSVDNPKASNLEVLANLLRNAFFDAILPGFERDRVEPRAPKEKAKESN